MLMIQKREVQEHLQETKWLFMSSLVFFLRDSNMGFRIIPKMRTVSSTSNPAVSGSLRQQDETLALLKSNLLQAQDRMKFQADKGRRKVIFDIGDWVYVRLRPYRQLSVRLQRHSKLSRRFFGPFQIIKRIGDVAYKLDLPASSRIHPVFHVSVLRKFIGKPTNQLTPIDLLDQTPSVTLIPEDILNKRDVTKGTHQVSQCLVKWVGLPIEDATWEDSYTLLQQFPHLNLEDKVHLHGGGNVMTQRDRLDNNRRSTRYKRVILGPVRGPRCKRKTNSA